MKWIGQHIYDFIARFRNDVYLEDISTGTIASGGNLGLDANNKIVKADTNAGELSITNATNNFVVTSTGGTGLNAESGLQFSTFLRVNDTTGDVKIGAGNAPFGYNPDVLTSPYGQITFESVGLFGTGAGGLIEQQDLSVGSHTGAPLGIKAGGGVGTNKAGGNLELIAGRGTGTGTGGSLRFWSAPAGSSGSSYNTSAIKFKVGSDGNVDITGGATVAGMLNATSGAAMLGNQFLYFFDTDNSHSTRFKSSTTSSNRTISLPDADGTVALTSDLPSVPDETVSTGSFISKQVKVTLSQANCNSLHAIPIELIPAQGADTVIVPGSGILMVDRNSAQNNSAADLNFHYAGKEPGTFGQTSLCHVRRFMFGNTTDIVYSLGEITGIEISQNLTDLVNKGVEVSVDSALTSNSMNSITIYLTYHVIDIS